MIKRSFIPCIPMAITNHHKFEHLIFQIKILSVWLINFISCYKSHTVRQAKCFLLESKFFIIAISTACPPLQESCTSEFDLILQQKGANTNDVFVSVEIPKKQTRDLLHSISGCHHILTSIALKLTTVVQVFFSF
jgi:hypothetical protein